MAESRARIFRAVRQALGRDSATADVDAARAAALGEATPRPAWPEARLERFTGRLQAAAGSFARIATLAELPEAVETYLSKHGVGRRLVLAPAPLLREPDWGAGWELLEPTRQNTDGAAALGLAYAGIAETGTVVMTTGPERPPSMNLLPDQLLLLLPIAHIVDHSEDLWARLQREGLPRTTNFITGPSRTADVEQTIQLGAHGARQLHVILLEG
jgi:L-lactate dehydrogenase complex protein LldG